MHCRQLSRVFLHQQATQHIVLIPKSLPQITVDGDTSTNDAVLGLASGAAGGKTIKHANSEEAQQLEAAVTALLQVSHACPTD